MGDWNKCNGFGFGDVLQCSALLLTTAPLLCVAQKPLGMFLPGWPVSNVTLKQHPVGCLSSPCQLSNPSLLPMSEAIKTQSPLGVDGLIWEMEGTLLSISY